MINASILTTFLQLAYTHVRKGTRQRKDANTPLHHDQISCKSLQESSLWNESWYAVELCVHSYETAFFIFTVASEHSEPNGELVVEICAHGLACLVCLICTLSQPTGYTAKSMMLSIVTYSKPVRHVVKRIIRERERPIIAEEQAHVDVTEQHQSSVTRISANELTCKRTDLIVSLVVSLPVGIFKAYRGRIAGKFVDVVGFDDLEFIAVPVIMTSVLVYDYCKSLCEVDWISGTQERQSGNDVMVLPV